MCYSCPPKADRPSKEPMAGKETLYETFYTKAPGSEKLRRTAEGRFRFLIREGWHEMERSPAGPDSVQIRFEREGATRPLEPLRKKPEPPPRRREGRGGDRGGRGGGFRGGGGGPRGGGRGGGPPQGGRSQGGPPQGGAQQGGPPQGETPSEAPPSEAPPSEAPPSEAPPSS